MNGQFKQDDFSTEHLQKFTNDLIESGLPVTAEWKRGTIKLEEGTEDANTITLEINGKWFFRQIKDKGHVRLKYLEEPEKKKILNFINQYGFYSDPNWGLGLGLAVLYIMIEIIFVLSKDEHIFNLVLISSCALVILFLWIAYLRSNEQASEVLYKISIVFGAIGYLLTAIASLLTLPLFISINTNYLKTQIQNNLENENE